MGKIGKILGSGIFVAFTSFFIQIVLSHTLTAEDFGVYAGMNSLLAIVSLLSGGGISGLFLRRSSLDSSTSDLIPSQTALVVLTIISYMVLAYVSFLMENVLFALLFASLLFPQCLQMYAVAFFQSRSDFKSVARVQVILPLIRIVSISVVLINSSLNLLGFSIATTNLIAFAIIVFYFNKYQNFRFAIKFNFLSLKFIKDSVFYSINSTLNVAQIQFTTLTALWIYGTVYAGWFAATNTLLTAVFILPNIIFGVYFLPLYHKVSDKDRFLPLKHAGISFLFGCISALILFFLAENIFQIVYPSEFAGGVVLFKIAIVSIPFRCITTALGAAILSEKKVKLKVAASIFGLIVQVLLLLIFRNFGFTMIAISFIVSEVLICVLYFVIFKLKG